MKIKRPKQDLKDMKPLFISVVLSDWNEKRKIRVHLEELFKSDFSIRENGFDVRVINIISYGLQLSIVHLSFTFLIRNLKINIQQVFFEWYPGDGATDVLVSWNWLVVMQYGYVKVGSNAICVRVKNE